MKKLLPLIFATLILTSPLNYASGTTIKSDKDLAESLTPEQQARLQLITKRVQEINAIDRSQLSRQEKKSLRSELRLLKKEALGIAPGGVLLTIGSLLIVILLLILLL